MKVCHRVALTIYRNATKLKMKTLFPVRDSVLLMFPRIALKSPNQKLVIFRNRPQMKTTTKNSMVNTF